MKDSERKEKDDNSIHTRQMKKTLGSTLLSFCFLRELNRYAVSGGQTEYYKNQPEEEMNISKYYKILQC